MNDSNAGATRDDLLQNKRSLFIRIVIFIGSTFIFLLIFGSFLDIQETIDLIKKVDPLFLIPAALKIPLQVICWTLRWHFVLRTRDYFIPFSRTFSAVLIRSFFNNMTPGAGTGGEPAGAYYLSKSTSMSFGQAMASTVSERMVMGVVYAAILIITSISILPFIESSSSFLIIISVILVLFSGFIMLMLYLSVYNFTHGRIVIKRLLNIITRIIPSFKNKWDIEHIDVHIQNWHNEFTGFVRNRKAVRIIIFFTVLNWMMDLSQPYLIFKALGTDVPIWIIIINATLIRITGGFTLIPGGAGVLEGVNFGFYTGLTDISDETIMAQTILFRALDAWFLWLIGGAGTIIGLMSLSKKR